MKIDGTEKVANLVRERAEGSLYATITAELLRDANTDYQRVYSALGGQAGGWDVVQSPTGDGVAFCQGCAAGDASGNPCPQVPVSSSRGRPGVRSGAFAEVLRVYPAAFSALSWHCHPRVL
jgi:hypothetical protein